MAVESSVKAEIKLDTTLEEYSKASLLASRRNGSLHALPLIVLLSALLLFAGLCSVNWLKINQFADIIPSVLLCLSCFALLYSFFVLIPHAIRKKSIENYHHYQTVMSPSSLTLCADNMITKSPFITLTDSYALMAECIETIDMFVIIKDQERILVIPKRCLTNKQSEEITAFLRLVFARKRHLMRNWIF